MSKSKTEVAIPATSRWLATGSDVPDYLQGGSRGNENVRASDLVIPRLEVVQALSKVRDRNSPNYIEGAQEGHLYNTVTGDLYGESVLVVPVYFRPMWSVWVDRKASKGKTGFRGTFPTQELAANRVASETEEPLEIVDQFEHYVLVLTDEGIQEAVVTMSKSKAKVSRRWNSLVRMLGGDRFSRVYKMSSVSDQNENGDRFYNVRVDVVGFVTRDVHDRGLELYETLSTNIDRVRAHEEDPDAEHAVGEEVPF